MEKQETAGLSRKVASSEGPVGGGESRQVGGVS